LILGQSLSTATDKRSVMSESNIKIVRSLYDAFARCDQPAMVQSLDPEVEVQQTEMRCTGF
jgi:ketosteroid isomerase-like protein